MFRKDFLRRLLFCLKSDGCAQLKGRTCACYGTISSKLTYLSRPYVTANNATSTQFVGQPSKKWKMMIKNKLGEKAEVANDEACEQGPEAVPHHALMTSLHHCSSVQEQINELCSRVSLTEEDVENRKNFARHLQELLMPFFPNLQISLFGSSINGFGFKGCDCDIAMDINGKFTDEDPETQVKKSGVRVELPTVADVESGKASLDDLPNLPPRLLLRFVRRVLHQHDRDIHGNVLLIKARHPILKFYNKKYNLFCDFSLGKNSSLRNTRSIRLIGYLDNRVMPLIKILRYWAKHRGVIGDIDYFNSYAFSLLVVYFLQNTSPAVLPPFSQLLEKSGYLVAGRVGDDELMFSDLKKFTPSENTQTLEELLKEFFFFYLYFDFSQVLCPFTSSCVPKMELMAGTEPFEFSTIAIQDPFQPMFNLSHSAAEKSCRLFLNSVLEACKSHQNTKLWAPNPGTSWGLSSVLDSLPSTQDHGCSVGTELQHTIVIPLKPLTTAEHSRSGVGVCDTGDVCFEKASKAVVDVFEYGLLFNCRTLKRGGQHAPNCTNSVLKLKCTAFRNVFSGRSNWQRVSVPCHATNRTLEREHLISLKVSETKDTEKGQALFSFDCELVGCYENDVPSLRVSLKFEQEGYKPAVIVFLKEYLPSFVLQSL